MLKINMINYIKLNFRGRLMKKFIANVRVEEKEEKLMTVIDTATTEKKEFEELMEEFEGKTVEITVKEVK